MMQCKKIQELLKADYLDKETGRQEEQFIKEHLARCASCSWLEKELQAQRVLFQGLKPKQAPERIWNNIRDVILTEHLKQKEAPTPGILERLMDLMFARRPVVVLASVLSVIIMFAVFTNVTLQRQASLSKQNAAESIAGYSLNDKNGYVLDDLGTNIEEYFL